MIEHRQPEVAPMTERLQRWAPAAPCLLALVLFLNILPNTFMWDDWQQIFENSFLRSSDGLAKLFTTNVWAFEGKSTNYYRPLMHLTFYGGLRWFGFNPAGYHLISIALHALICTLVFFLIRRWSKSGEIALYAALIFAAHPIHTENVCWISGYPDLETTLFILLALLFHTSAKPRPIGVALCLFGGLLSKETAIVTPLICFAWDRFNKEPIKRRWLNYLGMAAAFTAYAAMRGRALGSSLPSVPTNDLPFSTRVLTHIAAFYRYIEKLVWPGNLSLFDVFPSSDSLFDWRVIAGFLLFAGMVWAAVRLWKSGRPESLGVILFLLTLAPVLALPIEPAQNLLGERYLYLPSIGFCWLLAWRLSVYQQRIGPRMTAALLVAILAAYGLRTEARNLDWRSEIPFYKKEISSAPDVANLRLLLGEAYLRHEMLPEALEETQRAASLQPNYSEAANNLGQIYSQMDQPKNAAAQYALAIQYSERSGLGKLVSRFYNNLAYEQSRMGDVANAILTYQKAIAISPDFSGAYNNLGYLFLEQGQFADAEKCLLRARELEPTFPIAASNLGLLYTRTGKYDAAAAFLAEALRLEPRSGETYARMGELALAQGDRDRAVQLFRRALELHPENKRAAAALAKLQGPAH